MTEESKFDERAEEFGSGRGLTGTTIWMFVPVLAIWAIAAIFALTPIGALLGVLIGDPTAGIWLVIALWTAGAALTFWRPVEDRLGSLVFGLREPTATELERLRPLWDQICAAAKIDPEHYILRIEESNSVNAYAAAGRLVAVTRGGMELSDRMLLGILAHELGHHRDLHPVAGMLTWWFMLPIGFLDWCLRIVVNTTSVVLSLFRGWLILVLWIVVLSLIALRFLFFIPVRAAQFFALALGRAAEYAADRHAVDMGYGVGQREALQLFLDSGFDEMRPSGLGRLYNTHPPLHKRILALDKRLAEREQAAAGAGVA